MKCVRVKTISLITRTKLSDIKAVMFKKEKKNVIELRILILKCAENKYILYHSDVL